MRRACGLSRRVIAKGIREIEAGAALAPGRIRRPGAGRKRITVSDPQLMDRLEALIDPHTRGDPMSPLRWTCKSTRTIAQELARQQHPVSPSTVGHRLHDLDYSLQSNRKTEEGDDHPDRDAQFRYIHAAVTRCLARHIPVISVDTKKKELRCLIGLWLAVVPAEQDGWGEARVSPHRDERIPRVPRPGSHAVLRRHAAENQLSCHMHRHA